MRLKGLLGRHEEHEHVVDNQPVEQEHHSVLDGEQARAREVMERELAEQRARMQRTP